MNIEREKENPRKDYEKFGNLVDIISFFYSDLYDELAKANPLPFNEKFSKEDIKEVLENISNKISYDKEEQDWFGEMKAIAEELKFAPNGKTFKQNPDAYKGTVGDVAEMMRISLTTRKNSPNLYYVMKILGKQECDRRFHQVMENL